MKLLLGMLISASLSFGFIGGATQAASAAGQFKSEAYGAVTPVANRCISYHGGYYCVARYFRYGCIWYYGYAYCPAPPPSYGGGYHKDYNYKPRYGYKPKYGGGGGGY